MWVAWALAQEPSSEGDEGADIEIVVVGEAVERARAEVVGAIVRLGYDEKVRERDGKQVYLAPQGWKGKVVLYDDGRVDLRRRGISGRELEPIGGTSVRPYFLCVFAPTACVDAGSWYVSDRRWRTLEDKVAATTAAPVAHLGDVVADEALRSRLADLPAALDALWLAGTPLDGDEPLPTSALRRAALLAFWDSRTETSWGQEVRSAVAAFVRGVVQQSDEPYTEAEQAAFESARRSSEPFPWVLLSE